MNPVTCGLCGKSVEEINGRIGLHDDCMGAVAFVGKETLLTEDRYTPASEWCEHPERWHSADWDSAEHEVSGLVAAFVKALRPDVVVETGTAFGQTAQVIGEALDGTGGRLYTIEVVPERCDEARVLCKDLPVEVVCQDSLSWLPPPGVGFAWFDSLLNLRIPEFRRYHSQMLDGAIVGFHDTAPHFDLWAEIEQLEEEGLLLPIRLRTPRGVVFAEVVK